MNFRKIIFISLIFLILVISVGSISATGDSNYDSFKNNSDTEAILHGYEEYGIDILKRLRGMFAFVIWDKNKKQLEEENKYYEQKSYYIWGINVKIGARRILSFCTG